MTTELRDRIAAIRFYDIVKLAKSANSGRTLGIDVNRHFKGQGSTKVRFAEWCLANLPHDKLTAELPQYETIAADYYKANNVRPTPRPQASAPSMTNATPATVADMVPHNPTSATGNDAASELAAIIRNIAGGAVNADTVAAICRAQIEEAMQRAGALPTRVEIAQATPDGTVITDLGVQHNKFALLLRAIQIRGRNNRVFPVWLPGPAGSGKTTAAMNCAVALALPFYHNGALMNKYELLGFRDAAGNYAETEFYKAYKNGGIYLWDEVDASAAEALVALNAAIENGHCAFPCGTVEMHPDFILIAAANTYGSGATHEYVGRNKLDAATVDRFVMIAWDYDMALEKALAESDAWVATVQAIRKAIAASGIKHVVSPRASIRGAAYLSAGFTKAEVMEMCIWKGLSEANRATILSACAGGL